MKDIKQSSNSNQSQNLEVQTTRSDQSNIDDAESSHPLINPPRIRQSKNLNLRKSRCIDGNLRRRFVHLITSNRFLKQKIIQLQSDQLVFAKTKYTNRQYLKIITKNKCVKKTQIMKLLFIIRQKQKKISQRMEFSEKFQQVVNDSIKRQIQKMTKFPRDQQRCKYSIKKYEDYKQLIKFFLLSSGQAYNSQLQKIQRNTFFGGPKSNQYNSGVKSIQNRKVQTSLQEISSIQQQDREVLQMHGQLDITNEKYQQRHGKENQGRIPDYFMEDDDWADVLQLSVKPRYE